MTQTNTAASTSALPPLKSWVKAMLNWKTGFIFTAAGALISMPLLSLDYGIIWDEWIQSHYGKLVLKFLFSFGQDRSALDFAGTMYLYGGFFDAVAAIVYGLLHEGVMAAANYPLEADFVLPHWHDTRHVLNALFGFCAIFFTAKTAQKVAGWRAGCLAFWLLLLSPRFLGNAMNNPKDIPFAAAAAIVVYYLSLLLASFEKPSLKTLLGLAAGCALAINVRAGGILFIFYVWLFCGTHWFFLRRTQTNKMRLAPLLKILIPVTFLGYAGGILFWPYGWTNPLTHPLTALTSFSKFSGAAGTLLFEGALFQHGHTPWYYIPKWILISSPLFLTASLLLAAGFGKTLFKKYPASVLSLWIFSACFPVAYAIFTKSIVYDSWRHFLFVYPPLILISALAWDTVWEQTSPRFQKIGIGLILLFFCAEPAAWMLRNHPHAPVYFNPAVGGLTGAQGRYETDYWGNCLRQASEQFATEYQKSHPPGPVVIRTDGEMISSAPFLLKKLGASFVPYNPGVNEWQYSIELARGKDPESLRNGSWPGPYAIFAVTADRVPLCAVIKRSS